MEFAGGSAGSGERRQGTQLRVVVKVSYNFSSLLEGFDIFRYDLFQEVVYFMKLGIDIGSTTVKLVLLDEQDRLIYKRYERHLSDVFHKVEELLIQFGKEWKEACYVSITGSGGMELAQHLKLPFIQEVVACSTAVQRWIPQTDVAIELGGEDAKITFYGSTVEQRMNGTCAGGTGAFIDQMAVLLHTDAAGLNEAAKHHTSIYPIAARCGVFAKTDIQPLINEGAALENLAASIFQAVVDQTITGLACGRVIKGNIAFLGGPLFFLSELRQRFIETLHLSEEQVIFPAESQFYTAMGAALLADEEGPAGGKRPEPVTAGKLVERLQVSKAKKVVETTRPLFASQAEYEDFARRHGAHRVPRKELESASGPVFLGIDAGSTTTKAALIDEDGNLLYTWYRGNNGSPIDASCAMLQDLYSKLPEGAYIGYCMTTGYGESLVQAALKADGGEIETVAHYQAARMFLPEVDFILDIGGQDMKCIRIKDGAINSIVLNEACSSGCGSFLETYAKSVGLGVEDFAKKAIYAENPTDLGSRCTVFMNSRVKQAQKEGASIGEISAGLALSVIRNALYKVLKLRNPEDAGEHIVVQGGTFHNDAVLRSLEVILGRDVVRPDIAGTMGAYGAALLAKKRYKEAGGRSMLLDAAALEDFSYSTWHRRCNGCGNHCQLIVSSFSDGRNHITGNRCERGAGKEADGENRLNLFAYKYERLFGYVPRKEEEAPRGTIGIPRVLNMHENYPFWFTFFHQLGFRVVLSPPSSKKIYEKGMDTISSDTACYPAKLVHGHIRWLIDQGVKRIFYPCINYEMKEYETTDKNFNCPVVALYPQVIAGNMDDVLEEQQVEFLYPYLPYFDDKRMVERLYEVFGPMGVGKEEIRKAFGAARKEDSSFKADVQRKADEIIAEVEQQGGHGIVLAGRPYHLDPEINHGIDKLIASYGFAVLTESSVAHRSEPVRPLRVLDQWTYHSRLYRAAAFCAGRSDMDLVQLNSFGCGIDAVTTDQVEEILQGRNKIYTVLKIDEGMNLGAARIRIRSLKAALDERREMRIPVTEPPQPEERILFTKEMKRDYTLLVPQMAPMQFDLFQTALRGEGFHAEVLPAVDKKAVELGLKYINNDACYPSIVSLGQLISALQSGKYDLDRTAVVMVQTGGACRASNYIAMLRKALKEMDMPQIPVVSVNWRRGLEQNPGVQITPKLVVSLFLAIVYGDLFMRLTNATRPYEKEPGSAQALYEKWNEIVKKNVLNGSRKQFAENVRRIVAEFDDLPVHEDVVKPKVGVVGEILVKYHPNANNDIVGTIEREGGEAVVPDLLDFFLYCLKNNEFDHDEMAGTYGNYLLGRAGIRLAYWYRDIMSDALKKSKHFLPPTPIDRIADMAKEVTSLGTQCGEGWLLAGEMQELLEDGVDNIVCLQPFACLPNHIVGKGVIKPLRKLHPKANITAIDYDPGASVVNQMNRIKLMMAVAKKNLRDRNSNNQNSNNQNSNI